MLVKSLIKIENNQSVDPSFHFLLGLPQSFESQLTEKREVRSGVPKTFEIQETEKRETTSVEGNHFTFKCFQRR